MALAHSPKIITNGLVVYLDATNRKSMSSGSTKWSDLIGGYHANQVGTPSTIVSVDPSYAQDFTDSNYYQISNLAGPGTSDLTFSFWVYFTDVTTQASTILTLDSGGSAQFIVRVNFSNSSTVYLNGSGATQFALTFADAFLINNWYNIVVTRKSNVFNAYRNSVKSGSSGTITDSFSGTPTYTLGKLLVAGGQYLLGRYGAFQYYNRGLTDSEIEQNFNALRGRFGV